MRFLSEFPTGVIAGIFGGIIYWVIARNPVEAIIVGFGLTIVISARLAWDKSHQQKQSELTKPEV